MARCEDCTHIDVCRKFCSHRESLFDDKAELCGNFQSAADVAPREEVVREIFEKIEKTLIFGADRMRVAKLKKEYESANKNQL